jgi:hypothetical protein
LLRRLGWAGIFGAVLNVSAFGLIADGFIHAGARSNQAQLSDIGAFVWGFFFGVLGVGWSSIATILAFRALAWPDDPSPFRRPQNDRRDAIAILAVNLTILLAWALLLYGQYQPRDHSWW